MLSSDAGAPPVASPRELPLDGASAVHALVVLMLTPIALTVPPRAWAPICRAAGAALTPLYVTRRPVWRDVIPGVLAGRAIPVPPRTIVGRVLGQKLESRLQVLRGGRRHGWEPVVTLEGREHIDAALARGRGAVLWIHRFRPFVHFLALHAAGLHACRPSETSHGYFATSRLGRRWLNSIQIAFEAPYSERIVVERHGLGHLRVVQQRLRENRLVGLYADDLGRTRNVDVPFLGGRLRLATRALSLGVECGAPVLPVFPLADGRHRYRVIVEPALPIDTTLPRPAAVELAIRQHAVRLESYVLRHPDQWEDWERVSAAG